MNNQFLVELRNVFCYVYQNEPYLILWQKRASGLGYNRPKGLLARLAYQVDVLVVCEVINKLNEILRAI